MLNRVLPQRFASAVSGFVARLKARLLAGQGGHTGQGAHNGKLKLVLAAVAVSGLLLLAWVEWNSSEPGVMTQAELQQRAGIDDPSVTGVHTSAAIYGTLDTLLNKRGGWTSNDLATKLGLMDNIPNFEKGALFVLRDVSRILRDEFSRLQSQSVDDKDLKAGLPYLSYQHDKWVLPSTESQYRKGLDHLSGYMQRLQDPGDRSANFTAKADSLASFLRLLEKRLGAHSQQLSQASNQVAMNLSTAGDPSASQAQSEASSEVRRTPWLKVDDNWWEARGATWAAVHIIEALQVDFQHVLKDKNAEPMLENVRRILLQSLRPHYTVMVLNGSTGGYGLLPNHSLMQSAYISQASNALGNLIDLLGRG